MRAVFDFLRSDDIPTMARPAYRAEIRHMLLWGLFANLIDGSFSSIVVAKTFHSPLLVPIVWSTPMLAHFLSLLWGVLVRGRPKVRTYLILAACAIASAGSIALTPNGYAWSGWLFTLQIALARIFMSGLVTVRTSIWKSNYPGTHRARIAGRIQALSAFLLLGMGAIVSVTFDQHAEYYRVVYPGLAVLGTLSLLPLRHLRIRGEPRELRTYRVKFAHRETVGPLPRVGHGLREAATILRRDRNFAGYCTAQYLLGSANFMVDPVLTLFLTQSLELGYFHSYLLMEQIPTVLALLSIAGWARHFDRVGVLQFRVLNSGFWLVSTLFAAGGLLLHAFGWPGPLALGLLVLGRIANGIGRGGGMIAWNLGHLHFAGPHDAELYMGIHVALTGLRGMIMPFVGTLVYGWIGGCSLLVAAALTSAALRSFRRLALADDLSRRKGAQKLSEGDAVVMD